MTDHSSQHRPRAKHWWLVAVGFLLLLSGCGGKEASQKTDGGGREKGTGTTAVDHSSAEKVADSFKKALAARDWNNVLDSLTKESQVIIISAMIDEAGHVAREDEEKHKSVKDIVKKHVPHETTSPDPLLRLETKEKVRLLTALSAWIGQNAPADAKNLFDEMAASKLTNFKTEGDTATADVSMGGRKKSRPAEFRRIDGKWYVDFAAKRRASPMPPEKKK